METRSKELLCSTCNKTVCELTDGLVKEEWNLPLGYTYLLYKDEHFRIKEVTDEQSAVKWIQKFRSQSSVAWKIKRTYPNRGRYNVYKSAWRCQRRIQKHNSAQPRKRIRYSKDTDCPAKLVVTVKKLSRRVRSENLEVKLNPFWPCVVRLESSHNHHLAVGPRDPVERSTSASDEASEVGGESSDDDDTTESEMEYEEMSFDAEEDSPHTIVSYDATASAPLTAPDDAPVETLPGCVDLCFKFEEIFDSIRDGMTNKPDLFLPALRKMIKNFRENVGCEWDLVQALNSFGKVSSVAGTSKELVARPPVKGYGYSAARRAPNGRFETVNSEVVLDSEVMSNSEVMLDSVTVTDGASTVPLERYIVVVGPTAPDGQMPKPAVEVGARKPKASDARVVVEARRRLETETMAATSFLTGAG